MRNKLDLGDVSDAERRIADELVAEARVEFERRDAEFEQAPATSSARSRAMRRRAFAS